MKIGILTFHYPNNYGAVLQAYSLFNILKDFGHEVYVINHIPQNFDIRKLNIVEVGFSDLKKSPLSINKLANLLSSLWVFIKYNKKITNQFRHFRAEHLNESRLVDEARLEEELNHYDVVFVGSDQIWNPSQRKSPVYFLNYPSRGYKRVSYAADSTIASVNTSDFDNLKIALERFDFISVRNEHTQKFVENVLRYKPIIVNDPTLVYDNFDFRSSDQTNEKYILVYKLGKDISGGSDRIYKRLKEKYQCKIIAICIPNKFMQFSRLIDKYLFDIGPIEWVKYFKNASFVYTDSFHGCLFAMKFRKNFLAFYSEKNRSSRLQYISSKYDLNDFVVDSVSDAFEKDSFSKVPNYDLISKIIHEDNVQSVDFIERVVCGNYD